MARTGLSSEEGPRGPGPEDTGAALSREQFAELPHALFGRNTWQSSVSEHPPIVCPARLSGTRLSPCTHPGAPRGCEAQPPLMATHMATQPDLGLCRDPRGGHVVLTGPSGILRETRSPDTT